MRSAKPRPTWWAPSGFAAIPTAALDRTIGGVFFGGERIGETARFGLVGGYSSSAFDVDARNSSGTADSFHIAAFGGTTLAAAGFRGGVALTQSEIDTSRFVDFGTFSDRPEARYDATTAQVFGEAGYRVDVSRGMIEPFGGLAYVNLDTDGFTEEGGAAALHGGDDSIDLLYSTIGLRAAAPLPLGPLEARARGSLAWRHAFDDDAPTATLAFAASDPFTVTSVPAAEDVLSLDVAIEIALATGALLELTYDGQIGSGLSDHSLRSNLSWRF